MSTLNDLYGKLIAIKNAIINKGGTVNVAHTNPSPDELIAGVSSISGVVTTSTMPEASASTVGAVYKFTGTTSQNFENNKYYITVNNNGVYSWEMINCDATSKVIPIATMPTADSSTVGAIYRFTGASDVDFVNGKYYTTLLKGGVYSWVLVNEEDIPQTGKSMLIVYAIKGDGSVIANSEVTITNTTTEETETLTTDKNGRATLEVDAGTYEIEIDDEISGYNTPSAQTVTVGSNEVDYTYLIYVQAISPIFGNNSPAAIAQASEIIAANGYTSAQVASIYGWNLGDLIDITLKNNETIQMQIIGINHDTLSSDHTTKAGITLQMKDLLATKYAMNDTDTNAGGWAASKMRTSTMPTLLALLPDEWQAVIKNVDKKTANGGSSNYSATNTTSESLFLLSGVEIFGSGSSYGYAQDGANEGSQYEFYANGGSKIKNFNGSASFWWERSSYGSRTSYFCSVGYDGYASYDNASSTRGVAFGFCL